MERDIEKLLSNYDKLKSGSSEVDDLLNSLMDSLGLRDKSWALTKLITHKNDDAKGYDSNIYKEHIDKIMNESIEDEDDKVIFFTVINNFFKKLLKEDEEAQHSKSMREVKSLYTRLLTNGYYRNKELEVPEVDEIKEYHENYIKNYNEIHERSKEALITMLKDGDNEELLKRVEGGYGVDYLSTDDDHYSKKYKDITEELTILGYFIAGKAVKSSRVYRERDKFRRMIYPKISDIIREKEIDISKDIFKSAQDRYGNKLEAFMKDSKIRPDIALEITKLLIVNKQNGR